MQVACSAVEENTELADWSELGFVIDGMMEIKLRLPPAKMGKELDQMQFITVEKDDVLTGMFIASYDPGRGRDRGLLLVRISGVVARVGNKSAEAGGLSLEDIKRDIYLSRPDATKEFEVLGEEIISDQSWLRVNLIGDTRKGVVFSRPVFKNYVLILGMSMWGEESDKTRLFKKRQETLEQILATVKVSTVDF